MNPTRLGFGIVATAAILIAWIGPANEPQPAPATTAPITIRIQPVKSTVTTTSIVSSTSTTTTVQPTTTTTYTLALLPVDHVCYDWLPLLLEAGWPANPDILATALTIMWRESRCQADADSGPDHCAFQINAFWSSQRSNPPNWLKAQGIADTHAELLTDPMKCVRAALAIYQYSLERNGDGFVPWTTYSGRP